MKRLILSLLGLCTISLLFAQPPSDIAPFQDVTLFVGTDSYSYQNDRVEISGRAYIPLPFDEAPLETEIRVMAPADSALGTLSVLPSSLYEVIDQPLALTGGVYSLRVKWLQLMQGSLPSLQLRLETGRGDTLQVAIPILPQTYMQVGVAPGEQALYLGEQLSLPLQTALPLNLRPQLNWVFLPHAAYRITLEQGQPTLHILGRKEGTYRLDIPLETYRAVLSPLTKADTSLSLALSVTIKKGKLAFVPFTPNDLEKSREQGYAELEVRFPRQYALNVGRTYRLEEKEEVGGALIGEVYIERINGNGQMEGSLRAYAYHRLEDGPVFLKGADGSAVLKTQLNVVPVPHLQQVEIRRAGGEWETDLRVQPGEEMDIRLRGESLDRVPNWRLEEVGVLSSKDSVQGNDTQLLAQITIPTDEKAPVLHLLQEEVETEFALTVEEFKRPVPLRTLASLRINKLLWRLDKVGNPQKLPEELTNLELVFSRDSIDLPESLNGPQYLDLEVEMVDAEYRRVGEVRTQEICLCPTPESPRPDAYGAPPCFEGNLKLTDLIDLPLDEYPAWAHIRVRIAHQPTVYGAASQETELHLVVTRSLYFSLQVAFPIGILMNRFDGTGNEALRSLNLAAMLQVGFYKQKGIGQLAPVRFNVGMMATDAFNFRREPRRDVAVCGFFSVHPVSGQSRWDIPLYLGGGFLLDNQTGFFFLGPGLTLSF